MAKNSNTINCSHLKANWIKFAQMQLLTLPHTYIYTYACIHVHVVLQLAFCFDKIKAICTSICYLHTQIYTHNTYLLKKELKLLKQ